MKKICLTLTLASVVTLALSGCGKTQPVSKQESTPTKQITPATQSKTETSASQEQSATPKTGDQTSNQQSAENVTVSTSNTSQSLAQNQAEEQAKYKILQPVTDNLRYAENKDIDGYMSTLAKSAQSDTVKQQVQQLFKSIDIRYLVVSKEVVNYTDTKATVKVVQKNIATHVAEGFQYKNTQTTLEHKLVKEDGQWKIASSSALDAKELDESGNLVK